ncbi:hypothetical protein [Neptunomonas antarctica]|uniref:Uncharacterized protein n=1 Tax=Neptunomonas antarctica TaxID=619304 RepID=A0A1N7J619_9GAMM|nr:hypothetical protein [Neptunomonas antarctica]SIS44686.1 hypothetical protein SAMN05421760_101655 [Neptunomonas antarctica]
MDDIQHVVETLLTINTVQTGIFVALAIGVSNVLLGSITSYRLDRNDTIKALKAENKKLSDLLFSTSTPYEEHS